MRRVEFQNRRGEWLVGVLHGALAEGGGAKAAICCHGMVSTKDSLKHRALAENLAAEGIATLRFDFAGCGESEGSLEATSYSSRMADLDAAIEHLVRLGAARLLLFGSSMGGAVALLAAARDERVIAVATLAAVGHPGDVDRSGGRLGPEFFADARAHDVLGAAAVILAPILVVHGVEDEVVPVSDAHDIATAARNVSLLMVDGADHAFSDPVHLRPALRQIAEFLLGVA